MTTETKNPDPKLPPDRKVLQSAELMGGAREVVIRHNGQEYRLQVTRAGKLILTK